MGSAMSLPPGPAYLLRIIPYYAPSLLICLGFRWLQEYDHTLQGIPTWLLILATLVARPLCAFLSLYWADFANARTAATHGAVRPPTVKEGTLSLISRMAESTRHGYPGKMIVMALPIFKNRLTFI
jgi:hypothetical protein